MNVLAMNKQKQESWIQFISRQWISVLAIREQYQIITLLTISTRRVL